MGLRFQTRLMITVSALVLMTVVVMILLNIWTVTATEIRNYRETGRITTNLATSNIDYTVAADEAVSSRVREQMVFSALLAAEMLAVAEDELNLPPEKVKEIFGRAIDRSIDIYGRPLVEDIQVADENGRVYISTLTDAEHTIDMEPFQALLNGTESVVINEEENGGTSGGDYSYAGVSANENHRVVQVGAAADAIGQASQYATVQAIVNRFHDALDTSRIAVIDQHGMVRAAAGNSGGGEGLDSMIAQAASDFLDSGDFFKLSIFGDDIGVFTPLTAWSADSPATLYMQYQTDAPVSSIRNNITFISLVGIITLAISLLVCIYLSRSFARPLGELADGVRAFGRGNLDHRVQLRSHDEIQDLAQTFNAMAGSIQDYMQELAIEAKRRERLESELRIAAEMQASLLPDNPPQLEGIDLIGWSQSAKEVGGDFYDFIPLPDGRLGIAIGDATGKGLPAALLSTECWSTFQALAETCSSPGELLYRTNNILCRRIGEKGRFVTLCYMVIDPRHGTVTYASAGHNPPMLVKANGGENALLKTTGGYPLGLFANEPYPDAHVQLDPGDTLLLYSDGLTEAHNPDDELYGEDRVQELLVNCCASALTEVVQALQTDVEAYMADREIFDDMTVVAIRYATAAEERAAS